MQDGRLLRDRLGSNSKQLGSNAGAGHAGMVLGKGQRIPKNIHYRKKKKSSKKAQAFVPEMQPVGKLGQIVCGPLGMAYGWRRYRHHFPFVLPASSLLLLRRWWTDNWMPIPFFPYLSRAAHSGLLAFVGPTGTCIGRQAALSDRTRGPKIATKSKPTSQG